MAIPEYLSGCGADLCERGAECPQAVKRNPETGRFYITMGHAGFNSHANNGSGYVVEKAAKRTIAIYSSVRPEGDRAQGNERKAGCPAKIQPTDRFEMYSPKRTCGRAIKANGFCGLHNPDRPANPILLSTTIRRNVAHSMTLLAAALYVQGARNGEAR